MPTATLTSKGQITIPKEIRSRLGLKRGDRLEFRLDRQGRLTLSPAVEPAFLRLAGLLGHRAGAKPLSVEEMKEAVRRRARRKLDHRG